METALINDWFEVLDWGIDLSKVTNYAISYKKYQGEMCSTKIKTTNKLSGKQW